MVTGRERCDEDCGSGWLGEDCPRHPPEPRAQYVPSGQTMAVMGWVPEKGEPGYEEGKPQSPKPDELEVLRSRLGRVRDLASTPPNQFFEGAWRTALLEILEMRVFGVYDPPTYQGPETYTDQDVFVGVGKPKGGEAPWLGCGQCDPLFPCHEGRARCLRLEPRNPWSSLNDAIDLVVDLGGAIDEGIAARLFGRNQRVMQLLSLRSRKWLSEQAEAKKQRVIQDDADRALVLNSFTDLDLSLELAERVRASQRIRASWKCGSCRDTKRWDTGIDCPVCVGEPKSGLGPGGEP